MQKVAHYRRAIWAVQGRPTVERLIQNALRAAPQVADTKFDYHGGVTAQVAYRSTAGAGTGIYFTLFAVGGETGTVQDGGDRVGRARPPQGTEFLKTGVHVLVEDNHIAYVAVGHTNDGQITQLIAKFIRANGAADADTQFLFMARSNRRELDRLLQVGVKSIDLGVTAFMAAAEQLAEDNPRGGFAARRDAAVEAVRGIFRRNRSPQEIEAASELQASLHIGYDGRGASDLVPQLLGDLAAQISNGADEFKIVTRNDVVITRDKLVIKRDINVTGDEISLDPGSTFSALRDCLRDWRRDGILDD
ncbi:hypothetical protein GR200_20755 [Rhizobium leguminosarum]|uniref:hypothetical protein n=1 Tax=Rhizobium leguminosarum TaxID=384 RepID=UPI0013BAC3C2|nr:hypothetical protein [Rhizobium leguminosarum]NEI57473.1 hypothetical protein [Rhizobium leguminosarum]NEI86333.1 hypothetical protein [Rhizobium leguminosarum]